MYKNVYEHISPWYYQYKLKMSLEFLQIWIIILNNTEEK